MLFLVLKGIYSITLGNLSAFMTSQTFQVLVMWTMVKADKGSYFSKEINPLNVNCVTAFTVI